MLVTGRHAHALALRKLALQLLNRRGGYEWQAGLDRLCSRKLLPRGTQVPHAGIHFGRDVVRLCALRMILEHLDNHRMRLVEMTRAQSLVDLVRLWISRLGQQGYRASQRDYQNKRSPEILEHGNLLP